MRQEEKRDYGIRRNGKASIVLLASLSLLIGLSLFFAINSFSPYTLAETGEGQTGTTASYKSPLIWRLDEEGDYLLSELAPGKTYELFDAIETPGQIKTFTASWEFKGEVTLALSADNGENYTPVVYGVPLTSGFISGNQLKWRAKLGQDSELTKINIAYTDTSGAAGTFGNPALSGFNYRKPIVIARSDSGEAIPEALFNYQIKVEIEEEEIRTKADFADIRFTAADKETLLPYYLESIRGDAPARIAAYYVLLPQVPENGLKIYLYYNNPDAEGLSSGEDVFDLFDDFTQDELDMEKWEAYTDLEGSYGLSNSRLRLDRTKIISRAYQFKNGIIEYQATAETGLESRLIIRGSEENPEQVAYSSAYQGAEHCLAVGGIVKKNQNKPISAGIVYRYKVEADNDNLTFKRYLESPTYGADNLEADVSYTDENGIKQGYIGLETGEGSSAYYDWLRVRKYVETAPYVSTLGDEENVSLARFSGTTLAGNGDIIASSASESKGKSKGSQKKGKAVSSPTYTTAPIFTSCDISIIRPSLQTAEGSDAISIEISADGGLNWEKDCVSGKDYSAASDFTTGKHLLLRASFPSPVIASGSEAVSELKLYYSIGPIVTSANIRCSGATGTGGVYMPGDTMVIEWDNSSKGDNNPDIVLASCNFAPFGGRSAARMYDSAGNNLYRVEYKIPEDIKTTANIFVTATNLCGTATRDGHILSVDTSEALEEVSKDRYTIRFGRDEVEIGDFNTVEFRPHAKIKRWGDECYMDVELPDTSIPAKGKSVGMKADKIEWSSAKLDTRFYKKPRKVLSKEVTREVVRRHKVFKWIKRKEKVKATRQFVQNEYGGFEFEVVLRKRPASNVVTLPIQSRGLKFYYQGPLTQAEKERGIVRPENIIGSYAVYHENKRNFEYKTGKAFQIYRPKIIDANEDWVWGDLHIDTAKGKLTIAIDPAWLDNAAYPVIVDPEFGYMSIGSSSIPLDNTILGSVFYTDERRAALVAAYLENTDPDAEHTAKYAVYSSDNPADLVGYPQELAVPASGKDWYKGYFITPLSLAAGNYAIVASADKHISIYYDSGGPEQGCALEAPEPFSWPETAAFSYDNMKYSIYDDAAPSEIDYFEYLTDALAQDAYVTDADTATEIDYMEYASNASARAAYNDGYTKLLLHNNGDASASNHTYTAYGDPSLSASTSKWNGSMYFDGTGDYLSVPDSADWAFGSGDFTIDFWVRFDSHAAKLAFYNQFGADTVNNITFRWDTNGNIYYDVYSASSLIAFYNKSWTPSDNTWYHIALVRNSTTMILFIDGINQSWSENNAISTNSMPDIGANPTIGYEPTNPSYLTGYIDELRITKGEARWTSNFTPPTAPYTTDANTKLLLHFDGDQSGSQHTVTFNGDIDANATTYKFEGSYYFDGTGDYLSISNSDDWDFGTGDFTIDYWIRFNGLAAFQSLIMQSLNNSGTDYTGIMWSAANGIGFKTNVGDATQVSLWQGATTGWSVDTWYHVALVRNNTAFNIYRDGTSVANSTDSDAIIHQNARYTIGRSDYNSGGEYFAGYIDELRVSKGIARWTSNFTPPTEEYPYLETYSEPTIKTQGSYSLKGIAKQTDSLNETVINAITPVDSYTKLLLHCDGADGSTTFTDSSSNNYPVTVVADAQIDTTYKKFGTGSALFDGTGDYLSIPDSTDWDFGSGAFTIDFWIRPSTVTANIGIMSQYATTDDAISLRTQGTGTLLSFQVKSGAATIISLEPAHGMSADTWYHVAVVREGNDFTFYVDGSSIGDVTDTDAMPSLSSTWDIGTDMSGKMNGSLDELRISKGIARWTENFVPPTYAYGAIDLSDMDVLKFDVRASRTGTNLQAQIRDIDDADTKLLLHFDGNDAATSTEDASASGHSVTFYGDAQLDTAQKELGTASLLLDGTGDYLSIPDSTDWDFGSGDFTIDFWVRFDTFPGLDNPIWRGTGCYLYYSTNDGLIFYDGGTYHSFAWTASTDTWYHVAVVGASSKGRAYVDGTQIDAEVNIASITVSTTTIIGWSTSTYYIHGWFDEFRISKGIARWKANFTPPTSAYTESTTTSTKNIAISSADTWEEVVWDISGIANANKDAIDRLIFKVTNADADSTFYIDDFKRQIPLQVYSEGTDTQQGDYSVKIEATTESLNDTLTNTLDSLLDLSNIDTLKVDVKASQTGETLQLQIVEKDDVLRLHFDGNSGAREIVDSGNTGHVVTQNGDATLSTTQEKFGSSAVYFDGTGDYLSIPDSADWAFGSGDFTVDFWVNIDNAKINSEIRLCGQYEDSTNFWRIEKRAYNDNAGELTLRWTNNSSNEALYWTEGLSWSAGTWYHIAVVRNGSNYYIFRDGQSLNFNQSTGTGSLFDVAGTLTIGIQGGQSLLSGYIDELRISKGTARWTSNFTPPTSEYSSDANTKLLLHCNTQDVSPSYHIPTFVGTAQLDTAAYKWATASLLLDGDSDYVSIPDSDDWAFGSGDFTIDAWVKWDTFGNADNVISRQESGSTKSFGIGYMSSQNGLRFIYTTDGSSEISNIFSWASAAFDTWYHIAVVREDTSLKAYVNGSQIGSVYNISSDVIYDSSDIIRIGHGAGGMGGYFNGSIDELRILKGAARWSADFTPPAAASTGPTVSTTNIDISSADTWETTEWDISGIANADKDAIAKIIIKVIDATNDNTIYIDNLKLLPTEIDFMEYATDALAQAAYGDDYTKLLLHLNGDASASNHTYTAYGNPSLNVSTSKWNGSMYFDGDGDYLSIADHADWAFGSGDFTVDFWTRLNSLTGTKRLLMFHDDGDNRGGVCWVSSGGFYFFSEASASTVVNFNSGGHSESIDTWYHVALVRNGTSWKIYRDGTEIASTTDADSLPDYTGGFQIGAENGGENFAGYIDELRITKGEARWTSNFTPPTAPYTADANTKLLLHFDGDQSGSEHTVTFNGDIDANATTYKFEGSYYFDGTGDYLTIPSSSDFNFGTDPLTVDAWIYASNVTGLKNIFDVRDNHGNYLAFRLNANVLSVAVGVEIEGSISISASTWTHVALVSDGNTATLYVNGVADGQDTSVNQLGGDAYNVTIGCYRTTTDTKGQYFMGFIDELRVSKGIARWTSNFVPPTKEYPFLQCYSEDTIVNQGDYSLKIIAEQADSLDNILTKTFDPVIDLSDSDLSIVKLDARSTRTGANLQAQIVGGDSDLLLHFDGNSGAREIVDSGNTGHVVTQNGDATLTTNQKKFGSTAVYFDGTGDYLSIPDSADWDFGTGDFTIDMWVYFSATTTNSVFVTNCDGSGDNGFELFYDGSGLNFYGQGNAMDTQAWSPSINRWYHVALARSGTNLKAFIDGTQIGTTDTFPQNIVGQTRALTIGYSGLVSGHVDFNGCIDELRITKGTARWTTGFTPSTSEYSSDANTKLLLHFNTQDVGTSYHIPTFHGTAHLTARKFNQAGYFDGTGDYLSLADHADWDFGGDFSIDAWLYITDFTSDKWAPIVSSGDYAWWFSVWSVATTPTLGFYDGSWKAIGSEVTQNAWHHVAVTRSGTDIRLFLDGVQQYLWTNSGTLSGTTLNIGKTYYLADKFLNGHLDEVRITKGEARWTANFTPPTSAYSSDSNTKLLLHMDGSSGSTIFTDSGNTVHTVTVAGDAKIKDLAPYFGTASLYLDGDSDYVSLPDSDDWDFDSGDWTIDFWARFAGTSGEQWFFAQRDADALIWFRKDTDHRLHFYTRDFVSAQQGSYKTTDVPTINADTWYHIAFVRSGSNAYIFLNGASLTLTQNAPFGTFPDLSTVIEIGKEPGSSANYINGHIDEFRIRKGTAAWVEDFTVPASAYSDPTIHTQNITISTADTWETTDWALSGIAAAERNDINKLIFKVINADSDTTYYIDNIYILAGPSISSVTSNATGAGVLKVGQTITFTVTPIDADAALTVSPTTYNGRAFSTAWATADSGATYTATYTVTEGDPDQASALQLTGVYLTDSNQCDGGTADGTDVVKTIDANTPTISSTVISPSSGYRKVGQTVGITVTAGSSETGLTPSVAAFNSESVTLTDQEDGTYTGTYTVVEGHADVEDAEATAITLTDDAGNVSSAGASTGSTLIIDANTPTNQNTVFASSRSRPVGISCPIVSAGEATGNVWFAPASTTSFSAGSTMTTAGGTATSILVPADAGDYKLYVIDAAGNCSAESTATLTAVVDNTDPVLSTVTAKRLHDASDTITLTFNEEMDTTTIPNGPDTIFVRYSDDNSGTNAVVISTAYATVAWSAGDTVATLTLDETE